MARVRKVKAGHRKLIRGAKKRRFAEKELQDRLKFEKLLTDISLRFVSLPADRIDDEIMAVQKSICELLSIDICALWQFSPDAPDSLKTTHVYTTPGFPVEVPKALDAKEIFPWCLKTVKNKKNVILSRVQDAPAEAARDLETFRHFQVKSSLVFPLFAAAPPA